MKKILFVFPHLHFNLIDTLDILSKNYNIHTLSFTNKEYLDQIGIVKVSNVTHHELKLLIKLPLFNSIFFIPSLSNLWKKLDNYDIIIFKNLYDPASLLGFFICKIKNIQFIISEQKIKEMNKGLIKYPFWFIKNIYLKKIIKTKKYKAFSPTKIGFEQLQEYTKKKTHIPFAINCSNKIQKNFTKKNNTINILNISKFQKRKDQLLLLKSIKTLQKKYTHINFKITLVGGINIGDPYLKTLKEFIKKNKMDVKMIKKIPREKISQVFLNSDIFVLSSYDEPAAYSHLEAMAYGLPVICSDENGTQNYIERGVNGAVFKARSVESLTKELKSIIISKGNINWDKIERFGRKSREIAIKNHSPDVIAKKFEKILN